jgi:N-acetylglutamate synthase/N-acetylornithine aminotransferase
MHHANIDAPKAQLSELVQAALYGEDVLIARAVGRGSLDLEPGSIDAAFSPEVEGSVAALIGGEASGSP